MKRLKLFLLLIIITISNSEELSNDISQYYSENDTISEKDYLSGTEQSYSKTNDLWLVNPKLPKNTKTLFYYIDLDKHDKQVMKILKEFGSDIGDENAVVFLGKQTKNIDKFLALLNCKTNGKKPPFIIFKLLKDNRCYFFYDTDILQIYSVINEIKSYFNTKDESKLIQLKIENMIASEQYKSEIIEFVGLFIQLIKDYQDS